MTFPFVPPPRRPVNPLAEEDRRMREMRRRWDDWQIRRAGKVFYAYHKKTGATARADSLDGLERQMREARGLPPPGEI